MTDQPFFVTWSAQKTAKTFAITGGEGCHFQTESGERWLDFASLSYQANLGHGHRKVVDAIKAQCDRLLLTVPSGDFPEKRELAKKLLAHAPPGFDRVFFTLGGAEATENALKIARLYTGRHKLVSRYRSYHGATMGALTLSGDYRRPPLEPGLVGVTHVLDCFESRLPGGRTILEGGGSAEAVGRTLDLEGAKSVAAVFLEPVPGANGVLVPPRGYWDEVRAHCDRHGTLLVADCVLNGFGRLGTFYGFEAIGTASPDLITISKGLTGGYAPLGAVLVHERISKYFDDHVLLAGLTFYGHPLGVAAGLAAVNAYEEDALVPHAAALAERFVAKLGALQDRFPKLVPKTRALGLLGALELADDAVFAQVDAGLAARRVYVHASKSYRTIIMSPPLVADEATLDEGFGALESVLASVG